MKRFYFHIHMLKQELSVKVNIYCLIVPDFFLKQYKFRQ